MFWCSDGKTLWLAIGLATLPIGPSVQMSGATTQARDPAYDDARRRGLVGEMTNGYLGFVVPPPPELQRLVRDINIKRKALYIKKAQANGVAPDAVAFVAGCLAIERSTPGERYQAPDGSWRTRGNEPPLRDTRCPAT